MGRERIDALTAGAAPSAVAAAKALLEEYRDYAQAIAGRGFRQVKLEREIAGLPQSYAGADTEGVAAAELPGALVLRRRQRGGVASAQHEGQGGSGESPEALPAPRTLMLSRGATWAPASKHEGSSAHPSPACF